MYNFDHLYSEFEKANFIDCRISAFPLIENPVPSLVFIDLDKNGNSNISLETILNITLTNIKKRLGGYPTVLWTGNGYHIYQPFDVPTRMSEMDELTDFDNVDNKFLRFEKDSLSDGYADKSNYPSLKSCLLRVPGSLNSKCLSKGLSEEESRVNIVQQWDSERVPLSYQLGTFHSYLVTEREKEEKSLALYGNRQYSSNPSETRWIEKLLKTPIDDQRNFCVWRIFIPYLVNVKQVQEPEVYSIIEEWLNECNKKKRVDPNIKQKIKYRIKNVKSFKHISLDDLKKEHPDLYEMVKD
jgi:hypothetical protein